MQTANFIRYVPHQEIDKEKWDVCLQSSSNPLIYASSVFLDGMCRQWDALVMNDYLAIMPLPWHSKWLIRYVYSPYFVVAGGVFGKSVSAEILIQFIKAIPGKFLYVDVDINELNFFPDELKNHHIIYKERHNIVLSLSASYEALFSNYSTLAKRKIKKAAKHNLQLDKTPDVQQVIKLYCKHYKEQDSVVSSFDFTNMITLLESKLAAHTKTYILSFPDGEVCAFYLLLFDDNYVYWLIGGSTQKGKETGAFYYLTNQVIQDFANTNRLFRFEGSDHEGIYFFNRQFGGTTVMYPHIIINKLPWPLRYFK